MTLSPRKSRNLANAFQIDDHFTSSQCMICGDFTTESTSFVFELLSHSWYSAAVLCEVCHSQYESTISGLLSRARNTEERLRNVQLVCGFCCGTAQTEPVECESLDCPWFFERQKLETKAEALTTVHELITEMEDEWQEWQDFEECEDVQSDLDDDPERTPTPSDTSVVETH